MIKSILSKIVGYGVLLIGVLLLTVAFFVLFHNIRTIPSVLTVADIQMQLEVDNDTQGLRVKSIVENSPGYIAGLRTDDIVMTLNGIYVNDEKQKQQDLRGMVPITAMFVRNGIETTVVFTPNYLPFRKRILQLLIIIIIPLIFLMYVAVGIYGVANNSFSRITTLIALVCFSLGGLVFLPFRNSMAIPTQMAAAYKQLMDCIRMFVYLTPSLWLFLFLNFPEKNMFYKKFKWRTLIVTVILPVVIIYYAYYRFNTSLDFSVKLIFQYIFFSILLLFIGIGVRLLHVGKQANTSIVRRRQYRLTLFGLTFGAVCLGIGFVGLIVWIPFQEQFEQYSLWFYLFFVTAQCGALVIPLTFLNSFYQNRLLETETILKKRLLYTVITFLILASYTAGLILLTGSMLRSGGIQDFTIIVLIILLTAATFWPINNFIHKKLERAIFPDRTLYKELFREFSRSFPLYNDYSILVESVQAWFRTVMNIRSITLHSFDDTVETMSLSPEDSASVVHVCAKGQVFFWDELNDNAHTSVNEDEYLWAHTNSIALSIPIIVRKEFIGIMNIGSKVNNDDFTGHELEIFKTAAENIGIAMQTLQLRKEYAEKQRLDRELEVARDIQMRLLPSVMPTIPGLMLYGASKPCNEVGGDYYDAIPIDDTRSLLAIADVSGKGVGAAMLMANLQASLKIAVRFNTSLKDIAIALNTLVYENTGASEFITFFCGLWDSHKGTIEFVNAGHNPPVIIRADGTTDFLYPTGIGLGMMADSGYTTATVDLRDGDVLVLYTDGIEEAFNPSHEQFGIANIIQAARSSDSKEPCEIAKALLQEVEKFALGMKPYDDMTLIVAKRITQ